MNTDKIIIYQTEDGQTQIDVRLENDTVWLTQSQMAELFETDRTSIVRHINNIYKAEELDKNSTCAKIAQVQQEGKRTVKRSIPFFNLDMIISVGYRVNSKRGVKFRQWANKRIAATLFLWFLNNNGILYRPDGSKRIADNALVALTLMIAESKTEEKDVMVKVVVNLINKKNDE